jgi:CRISPR-associated endoribonuclease Cas6
MPISIVLSLVSPDGGTLAAEQGRANYAEVLDRIDYKAPELAQRIHAAPGPGPLICSGILDQVENGRNITIQPGRQYCVRVAGLSDEIVDALADLLLRRPPRRWRLGTCGFEVIEVTRDPARHGWAGMVTYEELLMRNGARHDRRPAMPRTVPLAFESPTAFSTNGMQMPLPLPGLVFGSLAERWNAYSPIRIEPDLRRFAEEHIAIDHYHMESRKTPHKNGASRTGGVGQVTYTVRTDELYLLAVVHSLADFALYSGVGVQTAAGMGQVRRIR